MFTLLCLVSALTSNSTSAAVVSVVNDNVPLATPAGTLVMLKSAPLPIGEDAESAYAFGWQLGLRCRVERLNLDPLTFLVSYRARVAGQTPVLLPQDLWRIQSYARHHTRPDDNFPSLPDRLDLDQPIPLNQEDQATGYAFGQIEGAPFQALAWSLDMQAFAAGFIHGWTPNYSSMLSEPVLEIAQARFDAEMLRRQKIQNIAAGEASRAALATYATLPGVTTLASGVSYRVLDWGKAAADSAPDHNDVVQLRFEGRTIDGRIYDSSRWTAGMAPVTEPMPSLMTGLQEVLVLLPVGTRAEIMLPASAARGSEWSPDLPGGSMLRYELTLIGVERYPGIVP
jgi:FKBP-type peptidyl-prolyl cis-trans isomerase